MDAPSMPTTWPGSPEHQRLLRAMTEYYARQPWALAFIVFGSVGRGNWRPDSDLDLDVVIADDAQIEPVAEITRLCEAIGERPALIAPRRGDDGEVVLASLADFSIRYHSLATTSPNIIASMRLLWGRLTEEQIRAAGRANVHNESQAPEASLALCVRAALYVSKALARGRLWSALASLEEARDLLMTLATPDAERSMQAFQQTASAETQALLAGAVARWDAASVRAALLALCDLLTQHLDTFTGGQPRLTDGEAALLAAIRARLALTPAPSQAEREPEG
ncbi:MAG TPA: nucleotidyltransferase domain-containing protein [Ktedonobacterales bacterium]|jgi:predicted nucleotidyltransferase